MLEPISTVSLCTGYAALQVFARSRSAISREAQDVRKVATALVDSAELSQALFGEKVAAVSQLRALANECAQQGYSGDKDAGIDPLAVLIAESFLRALPDGIPLPEFASEPDGSVSLDWIQSQTRLFTLSVGITNRLAYAWLDGADKGHAVARFNGESIPPLILEGIKAITSHGNIALRAA